MKERPILFSAPMVQALLAGRKTQTRRVVKPQPGWDGHGWLWKGRKGEARWSGDRPQACALVHGLRPECPYGQPGDRLWVRETIALDYFSATPYLEPTARHGYRADWTEKAADTVPEPRWTPSIFMPRWACRLVLEVADVRVERLQEISEEDAAAEGAEPYGCIGAEQRVPGPGFGGALLAEQPHRLPFANLWESINGPESWAANPWVWALSFKRTGADKLADVSAEALEGAPHGENSQHQT